ncbi:MAG: hypothetical protein JWR85_1440 [Marmoricola sp.]|nr:hypothetical protein [Marmoricola sp.]
MTTRTWTTLVDGLAFPECPRWHDDALWFTDVAAGEVLRIDPATGSAVPVCAVPGHPAGIGFLPDGRLLVAVGQTKQLLRREPDGELGVHADLSEIATGMLNDMHVDPEGRAYVGNYGDDSVPPAPPFPAVLALVQPDGSVVPAAEGMRFANGVQLTPDGGTLVVAETRATPGCLTAFDVAEDGSLSNRRSLAEFEVGVLPDGIAIARDGSVWVASPFTGEVLHVSPEGQLVESVEVANPYAVALGGDGELYVCTAPTWEPGPALELRGGAILRMT